MIIHHYQSHKCLRHVAAWLDRTRWNERRTHRAAEETKEKVRVACMLVLAKKSMTSTNNRKTEKFKFCSHFFFFAFAVSYVVDNAIAGSFHAGFYGLFLHHPAIVNIQMRNSHIGSPPHSYFRIQFWPSFWAPTGRIDRLNTMAASNTKNKTQ